MAYLVHIAEDVEAYIHGVNELPEAIRRQVIDACSQDLSEQAEHFLKLFPIAHESYSFQYEYAFIDSGLIYTFRFVADGANMSMGVVRVEYVDHETSPAPS